MILGHVQHSNKITIYSNCSCIHSLPSHCQQLFILQEFSTLLFWSHMQVNPINAHPRLADVTCAPGALRENILPQHRKPLYIFPVLLKLWISGKGLWNYFHSTLKLSHILLELYRATPVRMKDRTVSSILWFKSQAASIFQDNTCRTR